MKSLTRFKVSTRLTLGFGTLLGLLVILTVLGLFSMAQVQAQLNSIAVVNNAETALVNLMHIKVSDAGLANRNLALLSEAKDMQPEYERLKADLADYDAAEAKLAQLF